MLNDLLLRSVFNDLLILHSSTDSWFMHSSAPLFTQLLTLVLQGKESTTLKSLGTLIHSLVKVVSLNKHLLFKLRLLLFSQELGKGLHQVMTLTLLDTQYRIEHLCY